MLEGCFPNTPSAPSNPHQDLLSHALETASTTAPICLKRWLENCMVKHPPRSIESALPSPQISERNHERNKSPIIIQFMIIYADLWWFIMFCKYLTILIHSCCWIVHASEGNRPETQGISLFLLPQGRRGCEARPPGAADWRHLFVGKPKPNGTCTGATRIICHKHMEGS